LCTPPDDKKPEQNIKKTEPLSLSTQKGCSFFYYTLISLKGIKRLFSTFESKPRMRAACLKLRFVAARAFMAAV
jgi:hypothetical protein